MSIGTSITCSTYSRQSTGRRLVDADHEALVEALEDLGKQGVIEFNNVKMEHIPQVEQFCLAARTDVSPLCNSLTSDHARSARQRTEPHALDEAGRRRPRVHVRGRLCA